MELQIVFALLAHGNPQLVAQLARTMTETGHRIVVHYDAKVADSAFDSLLAGLGDRVGRAGDPELPRCRGSRRMGT